MQHLTPYAKAHLRLIEIDRRHRALGKHSLFGIELDEGYYAIRKVAEDQRAFDSAIHPNNQSLEIDHAHFRL